MALFKTKDSEAKAGVMGINHADSETLHVRPIHPFPARMAPSIAWENLISLDKKPSRILDPMLGSGTTAVIARSLGHFAVGFDSDPLSVLIAAIWCADVNKETLFREAKLVLDHASHIEEKLKTRQAYPAKSDKETRAFVRYWFDKTSRRQLASLSSAISSVNNYYLRSSFWCAFSRTIITKKLGVSLAMDISHSRPHKVYTTAPLKPFDGFLPSVRSMTRGLVFATKGCDFPSAQIMRGDARRIPLSNGCIDLVITSPPYLNAIDYMRGHKLSLIWMGYPVNYLRDVRSTNIGAERALKMHNQEDFLAETLSEMGDIQHLSDRTKSMFLRYIFDMNAVISEISRVLVKNGLAVIVVGDSTINGVFVKNSNAIVALAKKHGLQLTSLQKRELPEHRRYLPPPSHDKAGPNLRNRMREEVIVNLVLE